MKTIIIDSGGTSSDWAVLDDKQIIDQFSTSGLHPTKNNISQIIDKTCGTNPTIKEVDTIYLYGAGAATKSLKQKIRQAFESKIDFKDMSIESDLLGASRALCGTQSGVVCILGTGSNCALYNGINFTRSLASGGYLLGDEGSGYHLSKTLIINYLRNNLSAKSTAILHDYFVNEGIDVISTIYTSDHPNTLIASYTHLYQLIEEEDRRKCILPCFQEFIQKRLLPIYDKALGIYFTGSVAFHFKKELIEALNSFNLHLEKLQPKPIEPLVDYHLENL